MVARALRPLPIFHPSFRPKLSGMTNWSRKRRGAPCDCLLFSVHLFLTLPPTLYRMNSILFLVFLANGYGQQSLVSQNFTPHW